MTSSSSKPLASLEARMSALEADVRNLGNMITNLADDFQRSHKFPWQPMAIVVTVLIAIGAAFGSGYARDQERLEQSVTSMKDKVDMSMYELGRIDERTMVNQREIFRLRDEGLTVK